MKRILLLILLFISITSFSQFRRIGFNLNNNTSNVLEKVIEDFPNQLNSIRGDKIDEDAQSTIYASKINIDDADSGIIIQTGDKQDNVFSWKEIVFKDDNFAKAKAKFREYFNDIKSTSASTSSNPVTFQANYQTPDDSKQFNSIIFTAHPTTDELKNVVIDLNMQYVLNGWQISISVYEHTDYGVDEN